MTAWAGDSRAVAGVGEEGGAWRAEALSVDHSINDPRERARVLAAGGQTAAKVGEGKLSEMVCVPKAEGSLKVTRSLGDVPHHANDAVSHVPDVSHRPLPAGLGFIVVCSDGVWDEMDDATAVQLAQQQGGTRRPGSATAYCPGLVGLALLAPGCAALLVRAAAQPLGDPVGGCGAAVSPRQKVADVAAANYNRWRRWPSGSKTATSRGTCSSSTSRRTLTGAPLTPSPSSCSCLRTCPHT